MTYELTIPQFVLAALPYLYGALAGLLLAAWLRGALSPRWVLSLFESEGVPSIRLVLAFVVVVYTLCMQQAGRLAQGAIDANYLLAAALLGLGTAKLIAKAYAQRPPEPPSEVKITSKKTDVSGEKVNLTTTE